MVIYISGQILPLNKLTTLILTEARRVGHVQQTAVVYLKGFYCIPGALWGSGVLGETVATLLRQMESGVYL